MTFSEAYTLHGPDAELIAQAMGISPPEADRLINKEMDRRYQERKREERLQQQRARNARTLARLREIRRRA